MEESAFLMDAIETPNLLEQNSPLYLFMSKDGKDKDTNSISSSGSISNILLQQQQQQLQLQQQLQQQQAKEVKDTINSIDAQSNGDNDNDDDEQRLKKQKLSDHDHQYQVVDQSVKLTVESPLPSFSDLLSQHSQNSQQPQHQQQLQPQQQQQELKENQEEEQQPQQQQQQQQETLQAQFTTDTTQQQQQQQEIIEYHYSTPPQPPPPPPVVLPLYSNNHLQMEQPVFTAQLLIQQRNLRPVSQDIKIGNGDDKKKEALTFLAFYFRVVPGKKNPSVPRSTVLSLYTNKISLDKRYKQPNDMANLCGAVYTFIFQNLDEGSIKDYIASAENERSTSKNDVKKRKKRKNHDVSNGLLNNHDAFLTCIKYASLLPFIEFIHSSELQQKNYGVDFKNSHPDWAFTHDELARWESELRDIKSINKRTYTTIDDSEFAVNNSYTIGGTGTVIPIGGGTLASPSPALSLLANSSNNSNNNNNGSMFSDGNGLDGIGVNSGGGSVFSNSIIGGGGNKNTTTTTTCDNNNNNNMKNGINNNNNNNNNNNINKQNNTIGGNSCVNFFKQNSIPVNVTETSESFIIYAFIPFYKPNALKITVNQMDIILEGIISLPDTIQIPNGSEISVPNTQVNCRQTDIQEGHFSKVIRLSSPIAASTVGKRDGVVVIIAKKEEKSSTVHQL
ncbi:hypothetical protein DDB_G0291854 [Dictyostelium discoideum AX4]|uniref:SHSP domain-containing protein n=1 Tax=Dictyostelium discoideum TaxID=44689 RepID=Q54E44_DICDI|nr:hypothetical protein DDB_G0291854 [Dictyostelium discoideum AX4]EAL61548.1 hypothetical protein DDB_G0291854 [Dictyostelium discoideum AX4]|eukprot:XP_629943.1 hypothetical protein DDB_G0291854 [Dictyostelium discoideum AX4]